MMRAIYREMKLTYRAMWLQFLCNVCKSSRDETQLLRDVCNSSHTLIYLMM